jgi:purine-nucleoside phosphorylase
MSDYDRAREAADWIAAQSPTVPDVAVVLGSGLGEFATSVQEPLSIPYGRIPHWPATAVVGHDGRLVLGRIARRRVAVLSGRVHFYEGHSLGIVTFSIRVLGLIGLRTLILTNAAGGINTSFRQGALMVIDDHINAIGTNPLVGANDDRFGLRFPDMTEVYSKRLRSIAHQVGAERGLNLEHGIYVALHGPSYETPAEIRAFRTLGADAVGMSTVPEAIVARHMGMEVLGVSCITNMAAGVLPEPLDHKEVMETARRVRGEFMALLEGVIAAC